MESNKKMTSTPFNTKSRRFQLLQKEEGHERLLRKKIESILSQDVTMLRSNTDMKSLHRSLFELHMLVKQLYPDNETLKSIIKRQDLFVGERLVADRTSISNTELIIDFAKEIAETLGFEFLYHDDNVGNRSLEFSNS